MVDLKPIVLVRQVDYEEGRWIEKFGFSFVSEHEKRAKSQEKKKTQRFIHHVPARYELMIGSMKYIKYTW